jgi:DNA-binding CsgD family transcriptional regulator
LSERLERAFAARMSELPAATRTLLMVAAADDGGALAEVLAAATVVGGAEVTVEALAPAVAVRLVEVEEMKLRFRHPLVRSAVHQAASVWERQASHAATAQVLAGQPDRRAWHRAASSIGPDEEAASELERVAARAQRPGAIAVAVAALERAARLSDHPTGQGRRLLRAAELAFELGRRDLVDRLLQQAEPLELGPLDRSRRTWLREMSEEGVADGPARVRSLVEIADRTRLDGDIELALNFLRAAALRCWWDDPGKEIRDGVVAAAKRMPVPDDSPELIAILALAAPVEWGAVFLDRLSRSAPDAGGDPRVARLLGAVATAVGAFDRSGGLLAASVAGLRAQGWLGVLAQALVSQAFTAIHTGDWKLAVPAAEEAGRLARETAQPRWVAGAQIAQATLAGLRGDEDAATALAAAAEQITLPMASNSMLTLLQLARGLTALGGGRHGHAYQQLRRVFDPADLAYHPFVRCWAVGELAEAAVHSGHRDAARAVVEDLGPLAAQTPSPLLHVGLLYARPLLADDEDAEPLFEAALGADLTRWPFVRARLLLAYGAWLRRRRRVAESRAPLRAAREAFDALGAIPWGERTRQELRASGEASGRPAPGAWDRLSPQELQIAQLAAAGLSNREIGQQLYLSHRTVGAHLYRVFPKLGITSRTELRGLLDSGVASPA